jgi:hypothetical protein
MKKQDFIASVLFISLLFGCAASPPMTKEQRTTIEVVEHKFSKKKSYRKLKVFLTQGINDSNSAIKESDLNTGLIVAKFHQGCDLGGMVPLTIQYSLQADLKDKKTRLTLESQGFVLETSLMNKGSQPIPYDKAMSEKLTKCRKDFIASTANSLFKESKKDDW